MNTAIPEPETARKYYTVEEANSTLPLVKLIVRDIVELYADVRDRRDRLSAIAKAEHGNAERGEVYSEELDAAEASIPKDIEKLKAFIAELTELGIEMKDPETGLIDFYSLLDGREVFLCWKLGEPSVAHWHELDAGFDGRQLLQHD